MKNSGFKNKYSSLKTSSKRMRNFREVKGEDENVLQVYEADRKFSLEIRKRDGQCVNCGRGMFLGCSHYFGRGIYSTRYDPFNCITLCQECHEVWENEKQGIYKDYMELWLGVRMFGFLKERAKEKVTPYEAIAEYMRVSKALQVNHIEY